MSIYNLARKYRPKCLADLVGQPTIVQTITNAMKAGKLHQAYLLVGQFGSGKSSLSRILAAMENCETSPGINPCGKCQICKSIFDGKHADVEELDAAGNFAKVEQVRKLKEAALYAPIDGARVKYFILDEAHRMSEASNDSLLKLIEEPPQHVRFVLCTTDAQKIRPAIESRCQRHDFRKIYWTQILEQLEKIAKMEKIQFESGALSQCAKYANGSMRTAIQYLEKLVSFADGPINAEHSQGMFGTLDDVVYYDLADQIIGVKDGKPDAGAGFKLINTMVASGVDFDIIYDGLAEHLRSLMICCTTASAWDFISVSDEAKRRLKTQVKRIQDTKKLDAVLQAISKLTETKRMIEYNLSSEIALQQWFLECVFLFR